MHYLPFILALVLLFPLGWLVSKRLYMSLVVGVVVCVQLVSLGALLCAAVWWLITGEWLLPRIR